VNVATIMVVLASTLLLALGGSLALATATESAISASYRDGISTLYAAEAAAGVVAAQLADGAEWAPSRGSCLDGRIDRLLGVEETPQAPVVTVLLVDGGAADRIAIVAQARGGGGTQRTVRLTMARALDAHGVPSVRTVGWEEVR
jgi:hypothetical protein